MKWMLCLLLLILVGCSPSISVISPTSTSSPTAAAIPTKPTLAARSTSTTASIEEPSAIFTLAPLLSNTPSPSSTPLPAPTIGAGSVLLAVGDLRQMAFIPAGSFLMGAGQEDEIADDDEKPQHSVELDAFWIDQYEVTLQAYAACVQDGGCTPLADKDANGFSLQYAAIEDDIPAVNVTWAQAQTYCTWAGKRLPTEAEWEKAARGTDARRFPWGNDDKEIKHKAWYCNQCIYDAAHPEVRDDFSRPAAVGSFPEGASPYGVMDMAGNVWEWVADWYVWNAYRALEPVNPIGPESGTYRVIRGGSWVMDAQSLRVTYRQARQANTAWIDVGFRCAMADDRSRLIAENARPTRTATLPPPTKTPVGGPLANLEPARVIEAGDQVYSLDWSPDGGLLASGLKNGDSVLWDVWGVRQRVFSGDTSVFAVAWSPDGSMLADGSSRGWVHVWDVASGERLHLLRRMGRAVNSVDWSPDGARLASGDQTGIVTVWEIPSEKRLLTLDDFIQGTMRVAWSPDGRYIASANISWDGSLITLWDAATGSKLRTYGVVVGQQVGSVGGLVWSPDGEKIASSAGNSIYGSSAISIYVWDVSSRVLQHTLTVSGGHVYDLEWSPDGDYLAAGLKNGEVVLWEASRGVELARLSGHSQDVRAVAWSADGKLLASGSEDGMIQIWEIGDLLASASR